MQKIKITITGADQAPSQTTIQNLAQEITKAEGQIEGLVKARYRSREVGGDWETRYFSDLKNMACPVTLTFKYKSYNRWWEITVDYQ